MAIFLGPEVPFQPIHKQPPHEDTSTSQVSQGEICWQGLSWGDTRVTATINFLTGNCREWMCYNPKSTSYGVASSHCLTEPKEQ